MKLMYWVAPNRVPGVGRLMPAVGISVTPAGSLPGKMTCRAVVGLDNGAPPNMLPLNHSPSGIDMPSTSKVSPLRRIVLDRQSPVMLAPLNVSPTAMSIWCSLYGVLGSSGMPLSHIVPTSVPQIENRWDVLLGRKFPVTQSTKFVDVLSC